MSDHSAEKQKQAKKQYRVCLAKPPAPPPYLRGDAQEGGGLLFNAPARGAAQRKAPQIAGLEHVLLLQRANKWRAQEELGAPRRHVAPLPQSRTFSPRLQPLERRRLGMCKETLGGLTIK